MLCSVCHSLSVVVAGSSGQEIASHSPARQSTRSPGGFPAMTAALIAPIEMPATQSGCRSCSASAW